MITSIVLSFSKSRKKKRFVPHSARPDSRQPGEPRGGYRFYDPLSATDALRSYSEQFGPNGRICINGVAHPMTVEKAIEYVNNVFFDPKVKWGRLIR